jgi:hypothetical protein
MLLIKHLIFDIAKIFISVGSVNNIIVVYKCGIYLELLGTLCGWVGDTGV